MATTLEMVEAAAARLRTRLPGLAVEYFPEKPNEYRLNHPVGALLVSYVGSDFGEPNSTAYVMQPRRIKLSVTVVLRQLNGKGGAVDVLDQVRIALVGVRLPDCRKLIGLAESFLGQTAGLWQYAVDFAAETVLVEDAEPDGGPLLTQVINEENS